MLAGSCLCGGVRYEIRGEPVRMGHCHCSMCRKKHGAAFGTYVSVRRSNFELTAGEELVRSYRSSPRVQRTFCGRCGSTLQFMRDGRERFSIAAGTLDDDPALRPGYHLWTGSKAPWHELPDDGLLRHESEPD